MYQQCILDGHVYEVNPVENVNPAVRRIVATETLVGRYFSDYGSDPSLRDITQTWPALPAAAFAALDAKANQGGPLTYVHDDGTHYTVICENPTYQRTTPGGRAYIGVRFVLHVVSSP